MLATPHSPLDLDTALSLDLRKSKGSPANPRRYLTSSWDEIISGRRGLRSSANTTGDDFSMLFESIENPLSARQSPSTGRFANFLNVPPTQPLVCSPTFSRALRASGNHMSLAPANMHTAVAGSLFTLSPASIRKLQQSQSIAPPQGAPSAVSLAGSQTVAAPVAIPTITVAPPPVFDTVVVPTAFDHAHPAVLEGNVTTSTVVEQVGSVMPAPLAPLPTPVTKSTDSTAVPVAAAAAPAAGSAPAEGQSLENKVFNFTPLFFAEPLTGSSCVPTPMNFNDYTSNPRASTGCSPCEIGGDSQSFNCIKCGKDYSLAVSLGASIGESEPLNHSPETCKNQKCPYCCKLYNISDSLVKHINRKHNHIKTYRCTFPDCGKTFITRKEQQNHIARHSSEPRYFCEYSGCNCKYTTKSSLDLHITRIHGEKKYKCDLCDERYSVRGDLNQHMKRKHSKQRKSN